MIQPDFNTMTKVELRAYVIAHRADEAAFRAFVDRLSLTYSLLASSDDRL